MDYIKINARYHSHCIKFRTKQSKEVSVERYGKADAWRAQKYVWLHTVKWERSEYSCKSGNIGEWWRIGNRYTEITIVVTTLYNGQLDPHMYSQEHGLSYGPYNIPSKAQRLIGMQSELLLNVSTWLVHHSQLQRHQCLQRSLLTQDSIQSPSKTDEQHCQPERKIQCSDLICMSEHGWLYIINMYIPLYTNTRERLSYCSLCSEH